MSDRSHTTVRTTRVLLADDHELMRTGLRSLLSAEPDLEVIGEASNGREAVEFATRLKPHLVVMDIAMPELNGIEATRQILAVAPKTRVLIVSMHRDRSYVERSLLAGAAAFITKDSSFDELITAVRSVLAGNLFLSAEVTTDVVSRYLETLSSASPEASVLLTPREQEILQLVAEGRTSKEISQALHVSPKTVEFHRGRIMEKLDIRTIPGLTKYAIREGLTTLED